MTRTLHALTLLPVLALLACGDDDGAGNNNHTFYFCGNSVAEGTEICDGVDLKGQSCLTVPGGFLGGTLLCNASFTAFDTRLCEGGGVCGNGTAESGEACDGLDLKSQTCASIGQGYTGGTLACAADCMTFVTSGCTGGVHCGNNVREGTEACDGADLGGLDCTTIAGDFVGGTLACSPNCAAFDTSQCVNAECGDGVAEGAEPCDGDDLSGATCGSIGQGFVDGTLECNGTCDGWVTTGCRAPECGDGVAEGAEVCDGSDLGTATCTTVPGGFDAGTLACNDACDGWNDATACTTCGNGVKNVNELCEKGLTTPCGDIPDTDYANKGDATCNNTCDGWNDATACTTCGNGVKDASEVCDGSATMSCADAFGNYTGETACLDDCTGYDITDCTAATRTYTCASKPATGTVWNTVSSYTQTWSGSAWLPANDATTEYNVIASTTSCRYKCDTNYTWNGTICAANTRIYTCSVKPATGTVWNTVSSYQQTWNGSAWAPADDPVTEYNTTGSATSCQYACAANYDWNGTSCVAATRTYTCNAKPATGTIWNTVSSYMQTWTGTTWNPADDAVTDYNTTGSATSCRYKCDTNYTWNGTICAANTRTYTCAVKPATGTVWNTVASYTQTWNGTDWAPADDAVTEYNTTASSTSCQYICATNYDWTGSVCEAATKTFSCNAIPTANGVYNTVPSYSQTWTGSAWTPTDDATTEYNETASTTSCQFICDSGYVWNSKTQECPVADVCGNGVLETGEDCEISDTILCGSLDAKYSGGEASCEEGCLGWDAEFCRTTKQWGTSFRESDSSVVVDSDGNIFVSGTTVGSLDGNTNAGYEDAFLTKWNADGTKAWTKQWGTSSADYGYSIAVDNSGNIFVAGATLGSLDGNTNPSEGETADIFLTKWNADGTKAWTKQWGTDNGDYGEAVAVNSTGDIFVTGLTTSAGLDGNTAIGGTDIFLTKWNADGTKAWTKQWGTSIEDVGWSIAVDGSGNIFVAGRTAGALDGNTSAGLRDVFLTKWNADGTKAWTKQWGTNAEDLSFYNSLAINTAGDVFVAGGTAGALDGNTSAGLRDVFLTKWNADGTKAWTKQWGTSGYDMGFSVAVDALENIFVAGSTEGPLDGNTNFGGYDIFLIKLSPEGTRAWTKQMGTVNYDEGESLAIDAGGNIFLSGMTNGSLDGNIGAGDYDIFLIKW